MRTHYDNLKVSTDAPFEVIQAAYRSLAKKYHPDRNADNPDAARIMLLINTAYDVLSDPVKRAEHDAWIGKENWKRKQESLKAEQAARTAAAEAPRTASQQKTKQERDGSFKPGRIWARIVNVLSRVIAFVRFAIIAGLIVGFVYKFMHTSVTTSAENAGEIDLKDLKNRDINVPTLTAECAGPVKTHPDGRQWGTIARVMAVTENRSGLSSLRLDNSRNSQDLYVKLARSLDLNSRNFAREAFIPAHQQLVLQNIPEGSYVVKMMDVTSGCAQVSPIISISETRTDRGIEYTNHSMTFYPVINGNTHLRTLSASRF